MMHGRKNIKIRILISKFIFSQSLCTGTKEILWWDSVLYMFMRVFQVEEYHSVWNSYISKTLLNIVDGCPGK